MKDRTEPHQHQPHGKVKPKFSIPFCWTVFSIVASLCPTLYALTLLHQQRHDDHVSNDDNAMNLQYFRLNRLAISSKADCAMVTATSNAPSTATSPSDSNALSNSTTTVKLPIPLPLFTRGSGGLVIFFHVAKNGGTTIRKFLQIYEHVAVLWSTNFFSQLEVLRMVVEGLHSGRNDEVLTSWLSKSAATFVESNRNKTIVLEIHTGTDTALTELETTIQHLRQRAAANHIPFFVFSMVREPMSYAVSFYNYENILVGNKTKRYHQGTNKTSDFLKLALPSTQCLYFARGELATTRQFATFGRGFDHRRECREETYPCMRRTIDWIGTLDKLQSETLPLLASMLEGQKRTTSDFVGRNKNNHYEQIRLDTLPKSVISSIRKRNQGDFDIFEQVQRDYTLDMWTNYSRSSSSSFSSPSRQ
ncbi:hypothetical protein ACA910_001957 [Epithemia clementina (nom. ined.)]